MSVNALFPDGMFLVIPGTQKLGVLYSEVPMQPKGAMRYVFRSHDGEEFVQEGIDRDSIIGHTQFYFDLEAMGSVR